MWFNTLTDAGKVALAGLAAYASLVMVLRVSGKRTLAKLNSFDFVVTVALGSTLATTALSPDVTVVNGVIAFSVLAFAQLVVSWISVRVGVAQRAVRSEPTMLVRHGTVLDPALRGQRVTLHEIRQAVRSTGVGSMDMVAAVVLETDGTLSVISNDKIGDRSALDGVTGA